MERNVFEIYPELEACRGDILSALDLMEKTARAGKKIMLCGNGGSCADAEHIVGELMKGFLLKRRMDAENAKRFLERFPEDGDRFVSALQMAIPAIALSAHTALSTAYVNDEKPEMVYAQQVWGYGEPGDLLIAISTSGNSLNTVNAVKTAIVKGIDCIALTGRKESELSRLCTCSIRVPETETYRVQELHLPVYHYLCAELESRMFG